MIPFLSDEDLLSENIPEYLHMLRHIYRSALYTELNYKSFMNPQKVLNIRSHEPIRCDGNCTSYTVDSSVGHLHHYRQGGTLLLVEILETLCSHWSRSSRRRDTVLSLVEP